MIKNVTEIKAAVSTLDIVREFVTLEKKGANYVGLCPFHEEKSPSFHVHPSRNIYKCFGCGEAGDGFSFLQEYKGMTFLEAVEYAARVGRMKVEYQSGVSRDEYHKANKEKADQKAALKILMSQVVEFYFENTWAHISVTPDEYVLFAGRQYKFSTIQLFKLSWSPGDNFLKNNVADKNWSSENLQEIGVLSSGDRGVYDTYRRRFLFPIADNQGNPIGLAGRKEADDKNVKNPKYVNTKETLLYNKSEVLYGLHQNRRGIRQHGYIILVEGYTDLLTLHEAGYDNALATCGTALTDAQAALMKRYADQVLVLRDGDKAGDSAVMRDVEVLSRIGLNVKVAFLDHGHDPDSFLRKHGRSGFSLFIEEKEQDGIIWRIMLEWGDDPFRKEKAYQIAGQLLSGIESITLRETYIRDLTSKKNMGSVKKILLDSIANYEKKKTKTKKELDQQQERDIVEYGVYEKNNKYFLPGGNEGDGFAISNFIVKPLMLIIGARTSQRLVEITNEHGKNYVISDDSSIFTKFSEFKMATERMGNFIFSGKPEYYERVKAKMYAESRDCFPINVMGFHKEGFFTWGNGISVDGRFLEVDDLGIIEHDGTRYFLPAFSRLQDNIKSDDLDEEFEFEKKFCFYSQPEAISFEEWSRRMDEVHGWNGAMAVAFTCAALFRDVIFQKFQFFPHLNMFGPSGSGKTYLSRSVMAVFGKSNHHDPFNLASGTPVAFKRRLAQVSNGIIWFDEYSNDVDFRRVEALKGAYDGAGHERGLATNDNRTKTTKVKSAILLSGQQQPTKDIALFKRVISLNCKSGKNTLEAQQRAKALKTIEETGQLTQITQFLLQYRELIAEHFSATFEKLRTAFNEELENSGHFVEDRIINNHIIPVSVVFILCKQIDFGFKVDEFIKATVQNIIDQSEAIFNEDEQSIFWRIIEYLHDIGVRDTKQGIHHKVDLLVQEVVSETYMNELDKKDRNDSILKNYNGKKKLIYIRFSRIHPQYQERHQRQRGKNGLDLGALQYYLRNSPAFQGQKRGKKFGEKSYSCYVFDMELLPIEIPLTLEVEGAALPQNDEEDHVNIFAN